MTKRLYYDDSYLRQFQGRTIQLIEAPSGFEVILDQTAFYPTSGGQPHDLGWIQGISIQEVFENEEGEVIHRIGKPIEPGVLECSIDWARRFDHMQQHTGQHILSQALVRIANLATVAFHMGATYATIDLGSEKVSPEQLRQAEELANAIVYENRPIRVRVVPLEEVPNLGLRKESQRLGPLRIVEIEEFDVSACGGTHVKLTGEIGGIHIRKVERVNRQTRVEFVCGRRALETHRTNLKNLESIARKFSVGLTDAPQRVEKQIEETRQLRKVLQEKNKILAQLLARDLYSNAPQRQGFKVVKNLFENEDFDFIKLLANQVVLQGPCVVILGNKSSQAQILLAQSESLRWDLRQLMTQCCKLIEGKGGGAPNLVQGGGNNPQQLQAALDLAEQRVVVELR